MAHTLHGIAASPGIAIGRACLVREGKIELPRPVTLSSDEAATELERDHPIIVARHLTRAEAALLGTERSRGIATDAGGRTCHAAIHARAVGLPAVVGIHGLTEVVHAGDLIILDGTRGEVVVNPDDGMLSSYEERRARLRCIDGRMVEAAQEVASSADDNAITVRANLELPSGLAYALERGAEGVGLFRTEYVFESGSMLPNDEQHYACYREVAERAAPHPVTIRTVDIGENELWVRANIPQLWNRALGLRGIRYSLAQPHGFKAQLKGILRTTAHGDVRILLPMVSTLAEIRHAKALLVEAHEELTARGVKCEGDVQLGIMLEVPAAIILADRLAYHVDFLTIGTNDLIQYTMAADRSNPRLAHLYQPLHPAVLRMIGATAVAGHEAGITVSACGEMAGNPEGVATLLGLGVDELSTSAAAIPLVKKTIRKLRIDELAELTKRAMSMTDAASVHAYLHKNLELTETDWDATVGGA